VLLTFGAAIVFWAGLNFGAVNPGQDADERGAVEAFVETYRKISDEYIGTPEPAELVGGAIEGMFDVLGDPHSRYMSPDEYEAALDAASGEFEGIGAVMTTEDASGERCESIDEDCQLRVIEVLEGAPAQAAGLLADDVVIGVDGVPLAGSTIDDSVLLIRGPRGSDVTLVLERGGGEQKLIITRDTVITEDVHSVVLADGRVGYISIDGFSSNAADDFESALQAHLDDDVEGIVLDVRDDPGGFVDATVEISSQFLSDGAVFLEEDAGGRQTAVNVISGGLATDQDLGVVVLVNGGSASASEILGGALQDADRAQLVGQQTFGKGTVQEWSELPGQNGGFRLSVAKWLTRDGTWIDGVGLTPDVAVAPSADRFWAGAAAADPELDGQLMTAVALLLDEPLPSALPSPTASADVGPRPSSTE
jgi:carboxyl-terminal processing protease